MQVSTEDRTFGEIQELEAFFSANSKQPSKQVDTPIIATGPKAELKHLQDDLRKLGYKKAR